jgi:hypothetical protein
VSAVGPTDRSVPSALADLTTRLGRCPDLDTLLSATVDGLDERFGYAHTLVLLLDENGERLYTVASRGYPSEGIGSEVRVGEGVVGMAAARAEPMRVGNLGRMLSYARTVRRSHEEHGGEAPGHEIALPGLPAAESQVAVPMMVLGQLLGVVAVESETRLAFGPADEAVLTVIAGIVGAAVELDRLLEDAAADQPLERPARGPSTEPAAPATRVRFFPQDGSTFVDGDYLIKGVAGRILWKLLGQYQHEHRDEFTNREVRLDPTLDLPQVRDNFESRLILLKRRLDERAAPIRIEKTGRGRFRVVVTTALVLESVC